MSSLRGTGGASRTGVLVRAGDWMQRHAAPIRWLQWVIVLAYAVLIIGPVLLPLPPDSARLWNNLTVFAEFAFWGIWWPFVLLSMVMLGRVWCGVLCPEGALSEFASKYGRGRAIPRWMRWGGWPFVAFGGTTVYGQMVSVYQYPKAVMVVLGGSTVAAIVIGLLYGREKRVWCKYLCPVNGVFGLLARLSPVHYKVDEDAWRRSYKEGEHGHRVIPINCAPLVPLRNIQAADCHMCGRCSGHRDAIALGTRSASQEIVESGAKRASGWDTLLILYGMMGVAIGGFHWTVSPWFVQIKVFLAGWLIDRDIMWPLATNAPWYVFTHYPDQNDVFTWLDGAMVIGYMLGTGLIYGTLLGLLLAAANRCLGRWDTRRLHHLAQALIPQAGCGVFLGLTATTLTILRHHDIPTAWAGDARLLLLAGANAWSVWLAARLVARYAPSWAARCASLLCFGAALALADSAWWLMFWHW
ncbi:4Fe-4S binding protein [Robbsia sp. Bb-Pol-6]|uniref:4Fe-4S binding protein n=1 Tax=Robbsia betulipollinis TaxID=2981849 RepID=A0ABT3ZMM1_9BURK|nr:4Fe-4S binding protein [Robbsia betulipollinis]MCY0387789.1 4Fe-4S binding protein [Robbsia betulipollinis]